MKKFRNLGHEKVAELLIQNGADINVDDNNGYRPLFIAAQNGNLRSNRVTSDYLFDLLNKIEFIIQVARTWWSI